MNKNTLAIGTRVTFYPVDGASYSAEGTIIKKQARGLLIVRVTSGTGAGKDWACRPSDIIAVEPKPGAWGREEKLPAFRITYDNGESFITSMTANVTLTMACDYYVGHLFFEDNKPERRAVSCVQILTS